jgi:hypothetical protein
MKEKGLIIERNFRFHSFSAQYPPLALLRTLSTKLQRRPPKRLREGERGAGGGFWAILFYR